MPTTPRVWCLRQLGHLNSQIVPSDRVRIYIPLCKENHLLNRHALDRSTTESARHIFFKLKLLKLKSSEDLHKLIFHVIQRFPCLAGSSTHLPKSIRQEIKSLNKLFYLLNFLNIWLAPRRIAVPHNVAFLKYYSQVSFKLPRPLPPKKICCLPMENTDLREMGRAKDFSATPCI